MWHSKTNKFPRVLKLFIKTFSMFVDLIRTYSVQGSVCPKLSSQVNMMKNASISY